MRATTCKYRGEIEIVLDLSLQEAKDLMVILSTYRHYPTSPATEMANQIKDILPNSVGPRTGGLVC